MSNHQEFLDAIEAVQLAYSQQIKSYEKLLEQRGQLRDDLTIITESRDAWVQKYTTYSNDVDVTLKARQEEIDRLEGLLHQNWFIRVWRYFFQ